jgi:hypothetical protein
MRRWRSPGIFLSVGNVHPIGHPHQHHGMTRLLRLAVSGSPSPARRGRFSCQLR